MELPYLFMFRDTTKELGRSPLGNILVIRYLFPCGRNTEIC